MFFLCRIMQYLCGNHNKNFNNWSIKLILVETLRAIWNIKLHLITFVTTKTLIPCKVLIILCATTSCFELII